MEKDEKIINKDEKIVNKDEKIVNKDDVLEIRIDDIGIDGEGIGHCKGYALFVKDAVPGDLLNVKVMKTKKSYGYARIVDVIEPSADRATPLCEYARQCGGCKLQHISYERQLKFKQDKIINCLKRIGEISNVENIIEPIIGAKEPYYYRNKAQFPVGKNSEGEIITGFYAGRSHTIINTTHCYIQAKVNEVILKIILEFLNEYKISIYDEKTHKGLVRHILTRVATSTNEIMVCLVINGNKIPNSYELVTALKRIDGIKGISVNVNKDKTNVILGEKLINLWGDSYITDIINDIKYRISPMSFYQVNPVQTKELYDTALSYADLTGNEIVWDLYCGIGTISLFLAKKAKQVYGVEIVPQAIEDAKANAELNNINNATFFTGAAEEILPKMYETEQISADVIVVDPPRKGCEVSLLDTIIKMNPLKVVYVSCDPATLARDLKYMTENGYEVKKVRGCDMFAETVHVESVVALHRVEK